MSRAGTARPIPTGTLLLTNIKSLATFNDLLGEINGAAVYIEGNVIKWVGRVEDLPANMATADRVLDMSAHVVLPGMVNTHHHMYQSITKCVAQDQTLFGWLKALYPGWQHLTGMDYYAACRLAMAELILSGCTTSVDHHYLFPNDVKMEDGVRAARELGLRLHPARGAMSRGQSKGGLPPDNIVEDEKEALASTRAFIEEFHDNERYSMLRVVVGPSSQKTVTDDYYRNAAALAREYPGVRLHSHLAENQDDVTYCKKVSGHGFGDYVRSIGWDKGDCWFAHCCMLDAPDMDLFQTCGIGVAHCPSSNLRLASGICPMRTLLDAGINVGLGVDGSASNDSGHMLAEARLAALLQRAKGDPKGLSAREALRAAIKGGAKNLGRDDIGELAAGFAADIVAWRTDGLGMAGAQLDVVAGLIWCAPSLGFVDVAIINGEMVVEGGVLQTADLGEIVAEANAASARLCAHYSPEAIGAQR